MDPAVTVKVLLIVPDAIATEAGTVSNPLLLESAIVTPDDGAAPDTVTVHVDAPPPVRLAGAHISEVNVAWGTKAMDVPCELPLKDAVTLAVKLLVIVPAAAIKVALEAPAATVTDTGTVSRAWSLESETIDPPFPAAPDRVTVHVDDVAVVSVLGLQLNEPTTFWGTRDT